MNKVKIINLGDRGYLKIIPYQQGSHINYGESLIIEGNLYTVIEKEHNFDLNELKILVRKENNITF